ncbi:MAG: UDP-N-acetylmuramoyl-L-alanyl-D-glutamate--2,6-diaminopimelate ligase [Burkholderiales bacterium]|nr:UDP-N-acetylmuramoyl-L-alanyl-D-glutamate--2,6-diaminopimelate ligase [Burkholderiales bacterium]
MLRDAGVRFDDLSADSRAVRPGTVFLAYPGHGGSRDGRAFIGDAIARGAAAVLWERDGFGWEPGWRAPNVAVDGLKALAGPLASALYGAPSRAMEMIGVTGTNGKTSVSQWIAQALTGSAMPCAVIGTLGARFGGLEEAVANTTPDAIVLQRLLARVRDAGAAACAMEVSSIGLDQSRVAGVQFDIAVFTNLTRDHLDYHGSMAAYGEAKARLFAWDGLAHAVINVDDAFGARLAGRCAQATGLIAYGIDGETPAPDLPARAAYLAARAPRVSDRGLEFELAGDWAGLRVAAPVWGRFNVYNLLAVLGALIAAGVEPSRAAAALGALAPVRGRMEAVGGSRAPLAIVDYAHSPDALDKALSALRPLAQQRGGRLTVVFGCGGGRDPGKRPLMGAVAAHLADRVILTSDNPRDEDPLAILAAIAAAAPGARMIADRGAAIGLAITEAAPADVVLIAGKGHEAYQEAGGRRTPFSDQEVARMAIENRLSQSTGERS